MIQLWCRKGVLDPLIDLRSFALPRKALQHPLDCLEQATSKRLKDAFEDHGRDAHIRITFQPMTHPSHIMIKELKSKARAHDFNGDHIREPLPLDDVGLSEGLVVGKGWVEQDSCGEIWLKDDTTPKTDERADAGFDRICHAGP